MGNIINNKNEIFNNENNNEINNENNNFNNENNNENYNKCFYCYKHIFNNDKNSLEFNENNYNNNNTNENLNNNNENNIFFMIKKSLIKDNLYNHKYCNSINNLNLNNKKRNFIKNKNFTTEINNFDAYKIKKIIKLQKKIKSFLKERKLKFSNSSKKTSFMNRKKKNENKSSNNVSKYNILKEEEEIENLYKEFKINNESEGSLSNSNSNSKHKISKNSNKSVNFNFIPSLPFNLKKQPSKFHNKSRYSKNSLLYSKFLQEKSDSLLDPNQIKGYFLKKKKTLQIHRFPQQKNQQKRRFW